MPSRALRGTYTELQKAVQSLRSAGRQTNQELSASASVSTRTLQEVIEGKFAKDPHPTPKKLRGYAESLTRLSLLCELDPESVLREYGLDLAVAEVSAAMNRVRDRSAPQWTVSDPVLDRIRGRGGEVRAGILRWEPFVRIDGEVEKTWAWNDYVRPLLGTVNPLWKHKLEGIPTIREAIGAVQSSRKDACDLVFGVYDTAYRRTLGLAFVPLPGLGAPLGVVFERLPDRNNAAQEATRPNDGTELSWDSLLNQQGEFKAFALKEEAGHLFLKGICGFPEGARTTGPELVTIDEGHTGKLAFDFLKSVVEGRAIDFRRRIVVADLPTCGRLISQIQRTDSLLAENGIEDKKLKEQYGKAAASIDLLRPRLQDPAQDIAPIYPVGIAIRADAERWEELLRTATQELFRNSTGLVARAYKQLLHTGASTLYPLPLEPYIPRYQAEEFTKKILPQLEVASNGWAKDARSVWLEQAPKIWLSGRSLLENTPKGKDTKAV